MSVAATATPEALSRRLKQRLKPAYFGCRRLVSRTLFRYSPETLHAAVRSIGVTRGDTVLVHSGFPPDSGFVGTPGDVVDTLLDAIGADGNLMMMSIPYRGSSQRYAESDPLFDPDHTPSAVGIVSEVFRRRPGVLRSASPFHPVTAAGPLAAWLTVDHDKTRYSCGPGTPFDRLLALNGVFLFVDAPFRALTFMHYVEHRLKDQLPVSLYEAEPARVRVRHGDGERSVRQFVFSAEARERRDFAPIERALVHGEMLRSVRIGRTRLRAVRALDVAWCADDWLARGKSLYR